MESVNQVAVELVDEAIDFADDLGIGVTQLENNATVIDCGVSASGGLEAGVLVAEIQAGGLIVTRTRLDSIDGVPWTDLELECDDPGRLRRVSRPGNVLRTDGFSGVIGGPVQVLLGDSIPPREDEFDFTVVTCYSTDLPGASAARQIAEQTGTPTSGVFFVVCPLDSLSGRAALAATTPSGVLSLIGSAGIDSSEMQAVTARAPIPPRKTSMVETGIDAMELGGSVQVFVSRDVEDVGSVEEEYENWLRNPEYRELMGSDSRTPTDVRVPHSTIVGTDGGVVELGAPNAQLLREKWIP